MLCRRVGRWLGTGTGTGTRPGGSADDVADGGGEAGEDLGERLLQRVADGDLAVVVGDHPPQQWLTGGVGFHVHRRDPHHAAGEGDHLQVAERDGGALLPEQRDCLADLGVGDHGGTDGVRTLRHRVERELVGDHAPVRARVAARRHVGDQLLALVGGAERLERTEQLEARVFRAGRVEHRVVGHESGRGALPGEVGGCSRACGVDGAPAEDRLGVTRLLRRREGDGPCAAPVEEVVRVESVLRVRRGLHPEQLLRVAEVVDEAAAHCGRWFHETGECRHPHLQDRVGLVDLVEVHRAVVRIDRCLDAVAGVVEHVVEPAPGVDLCAVGELAVRVAVAGGVAVDHPQDAAVGGDRVRVVVERDERSDLLDAGPHIAHGHEARGVGDRTRTQQVVVELVEREREPAEPGVQLHSGVAQVRTHVLHTLAGLLGHGGVQHGVALQRRAEVQLGPHHLRDAVLVHGFAVALDLVRRCDGQPAAVGVDEVRALPRLVADLRQVELAGAHDHLLQSPVHLVAVGVEIGDRHARLTFVGAEPRLHLLVRLQQPHVLHRGHVLLRLRGGDGAELHRLHLHVVDAQCVARRLDVERDVLLFLVLLVRVHHERLDDGRVDDATDQRDDGPERGRDDGGSPLVGLEGDEEQRSREECDEGEQHDGRELGVDDGVVGTGERASVGGGERVASHPVVARLHHCQHGEQHCEVGLRRAADLRARRLNDDAA